MTIQRCNQEAELESYKPLCSVPPPVIPPSPHPHIDCVCSESTKKSQLTVSPQRTGRGGGEAVIFHFSLLINQRQTDSFNSFESLTLTFVHPS